MCLDTKLAIIFICYWQPSHIQFFRFTKIYSRF